MLCKLLEKKSLDSPLDVAIQLTYSKSIDIATKKTSQVLKKRGQV